MVTQSVDEIEVGHMHCRLNYDQVSTISRAISELSVYIFHLLDGARQTHSLIIQALAYKNSPFQLKQQI